MQSEFEQRVLTGELRTSALTYFKKKLENGGAFSHSLLESSKLELGHMLAFLPKGVSDSTVGAFKVGGLLGEREHHGNQQNSIIYEQVSLHLSDSAGNLVILEDALSKPDDAYIRNNALLERLCVVQEDKVYYKLTARSLSHGEYKAVINATSNSWQFVSVFLSVPEEIQLLIGKNISARRVNELAQYVSSIAIDAYDGESFLFWRLDQTI